MEQGTPLRRLRLYRSDVLEKALIGFFTVLFLYNAYRYPFRINSTGTSPTYANTPPLLSAGKYLLVLGIIFYLVAGFKRSQLGLWPEGNSWRLAYLYLLIIPLVYGALTGSRTLLESGFFYLVPLVLHFAGRRYLRAERLSRVLKWAVIVAIGFDAVEVVARIVWNRLPALAYPGSFVLSRFGSFLDDPNSFGVLLALFGGYSLFAFKGWRRTVALLGLLTALELTESFTAYSVVPVSILCLWFVAGNRRTRFRLAISGCVAVLGAVVVWVSVPAVREIYQLLVSNKQGSVTGHVGQLSEGIARMSPLTLAGLVPDTRMIESGYVNILLNCGLVYLCTYLAVLGVSLRRYARLVAAKRLSDDARAVAAGAFSFLVAVLLGTANLPFEHIYPIDGLVALLMGLVSSQIVLEFRIAAIDARNHSPVRRAPGRAVWEAGEPEATL